MEPQSRPRKTSPCFWPEGPRPDRVGHAVLGHHLPRDLRRAFDVVRRARRHVAGHDLLGDASAHQHRELVAHLLARHQELVLLGKRERVPERTAARDHRDLVDLVGVGQDVRDHGVTALVVRDQPALFLVHDARLPLGTGHHAVDGLLDLLHRDRLLGATRGEQRGLVDHVRQVGTREARRASREHGHVDRGVERLAARVHLQDGLASLQVGPVDHDLSVEAAGPQQRRIQDVGAVRRGHQDHRRPLVEPVHLDQELVEGLLALVMAAAQARAAVTADGIDLVDEHDRGRRRLRLLEQIADARGADAHEHLDEVRAADREERHACLAGDGAREQRLARPGRTEQEHASRDLRAHRLELGGRLQVLLDLFELLDRLVHAGDVGERRLRLVLRRRSCGGCGRTASRAHRRPASGSSPRAGPRRSGRPGGSP